MEFSTQPAHSETIFDCRFKPSSPNILATSSYDSTIKVGIASSDCSLALGLTFG
jgi:hypothetical protein